MSTNHLRIALVHDWLTGIRGGEKCLEVACLLWPDSELLTLLRSQVRLPPAIEHLPITTSFLQRLPAVGRYYRYLLPLMPAAIESFRLANVEAVLSFSHCVAKAIRPPHGVPHICYCFTPMRYAWELREAYFPRRRGFRSWMVHRLLDQLQDWDRRTASRVTHFIAISDTVRQRIQRCYGRSSVVIYPPVATDFYTPAKVRREDYYLVVSAFAPYKRIDLAIEACSRLKRHLLVIGTGQQEKCLRRLAGPTVVFAGWQSDEVIRHHLRRCRALLFPGEEDFGIVPIEANACGTPVICLGRGGTAETILPLGQSAHPTGVWFEDQSVDDVIDAIRRFEANLTEFDPAACRRQALRFARSRFVNELRGYVESVVLGEPAVRRAA